MLFTNNIDSISNILISKDNKDYIHCNNCCRDNLIEKDNINIVFTNTIINVIYTCNKCKQIVNLKQFVNRSCGYYIAYTFDQLIISNPIIHEKIVEFCQDRNFKYVKTKQIITYFDQFGGKNWSVDKICNECKNTQSIRYKDITYYDSINTIYNNLPYIIYWTCDNCSFANELDKCDNYNKFIPQSVVVRLKEEYEEKNSKMTYVYRLLRNWL